MSDLRYNQYINWDTFNAATYREHYFEGQLESEDAWFMRTTAEFFAEQGTPLHSIEHAIDVGTGPSLVLPMAIAPYVQRLDLLEPGQQNVDYLRAALHDEMRLRRDWSEVHSQLINVETQRYENVIGDLMMRANVVQGIVQDLKPNTYDALTMGFCVESVTESPEECAEMLSSVLGSVKKGAPYAASHTEYSEGYPDYSTTTDDRIDMKKFPSTKVGQEWYERQYEGTNIRVIRCPLPSAMRPGYNATLLAIGTK